MIHFKGIIVILLVGLAVADNYTIYFNCSSCTNSNESCLYFNGGPFNNNQLNASEFGRSNCNSNISQQISFNNANITFDCDRSKHNCSDSCWVKYSGYAFGYCTNSNSMTKIIAQLNKYYSYVENDPTLSKTYDWCSEACGAGLAVWVIIVIIVAGVIVIAGVVVGIWWWRKKKGGQPNDYLNVDAAKNLLK